MGLMIALDDRQDCRLSWVIGLSILLGDKQGNRLAMSWSKFLVHGWVVCLWYFGGVGFGKNMFVVSFALTCGFGIKMSLWAFEHDLKHEPTSKDTHICS